MKKGKHIVILWAALLVCFTFISANCAEKPTLKIGAIFSVQGRASALGVPEKNTIEMLLQEVNKAGGVNGFLLEVIIMDDESLGIGTKRAAEKLIHTDKVLAIIGPSTSGNTLEIKSIVQDSKTPMVSCAAAETIVAPIEKSEYSFKVAQHDSHVVKRLLEHMDQKQIKRIAILAERTPFGEHGAAQIKSLAPEHGIQIVSEDYFNINSFDVTVQLEKIQKSPAQAMVNWSVVPSQTLTPKNARQIGLRIPVYHSHGFGNPKLIESCGEDCEGVMFPAGRLLVADSLPANHIQKSVLTNYADRYREKFGPASTFGGHVYDAFWIVVNAMKSQGITPSMDLVKARDLIRDGIEKAQGWVGTAGEFNLSSRDHCGLDKDKSLEMCTVKSGRIVPISQN